jgi:hypothetical protein
MANKGFKAEQEENSKKIFISTESTPYSTRPLYEPDVEPETAL